MTFKPNCCTSNNLPQLTRLAWGEVKMIDLPGFA
jgi:hypothetical protein